MLPIVSYPRSPVLAPLVAVNHYHQGMLAPALERIMPSGRAHLMINLGEDAFRTYDGPDCTKRFLFQARSQD